jgi:very-short-patch-repair endonuclease
VADKPRRIVRGQEVSAEEHSFARRLRREMSPIERRLWSHIRNNKAGFHFRRQQVVGQYVADFYCHQAGLVIEVDGDTHQDPERDAARDRAFEAKSIRVLRFTNLDVFHNIDGVMYAIMEALKASA